MHFHPFLPFNKPLYTPLANTLAPQEYEAKSSDDQYSIREELQQDKCVAERRFITQTKREAAIEDIVASRDFDLDGLRIEGLGLPTPARNLQGIMEAKWRAISDLPLSPDVAPRNAHSGSS